VSCIQNRCIVQAGAKALIPEDLYPIAQAYVFSASCCIFPTSIRGTTYVAPQVLVNVNHSESNPKVAIPSDGSFFVSNGRYDGTSSNQAAWT